jgi:hypothetical protein
VTLKRELWSLRLLEAPRTRAKRREANVQGQVWEGASHVALPAGLSDARYLRIHVECPQEKILAVCAAEGLLGVLIQCPQAAT